jgi:hypothetical protein
MDDLFAEFVHQNDEVKELAYRSHIFDPPPHMHNDDGRFVVEPLQPRVLAAWHAQLETYRTKLVV